MGSPLSQQDFKELYFSAPSFQDERVRHGFFGRSGGVSTGVYASLNCGQGSDDNPSNVAQNRRIVAEAMGVKPSHLLSLHQIHSAQCVVARAPWGDSYKPQADGMVTDVAGLALGVLTADCGPVLFHGKKADGQCVIGAAHAGWGGAFKGVLGATVEQMIGLGAGLESIRAVVGPCIGQKSYEVGMEFAEKFLEQDEGNEKFFISAQRDGHLMFDLPGYCAMRLAEAGVKNVVIKDLDTYFNEEDFFSYRRTTHRKEEDYGRQISVVVIKP